MATVHVQVAVEVQKNEADAAKRTIVYPVTTSEVSATETVSKAGGAFDTSAAAQAVLDGTLVKLVLPVADLDTLGTLAYKLEGATDTVYLSGIQVRDYDPYSEGAKSDLALHFNAA